MRVYLHLSLLGLTILLFGCAGLDTPAPTSKPVVSTPTPEPITITWAYWGDPWEVEINEKVVEIFEQDNPHIKIETFHRPWNDYFKELRSSFEAGEPVPDVLFWAQAPIDIPNGYFMDLTETMKAQDYDLEDFYPGLMVHFNVNNKLYGLPRDSDTKVIFYNKRLFNRADVSYPKADWTWDDLRNTALALKKANVVEYSFAYEANNWWMIWMWQNEVQVFDDKLFPSKTFLGEPSAAEAIQFFADLTNVDQVTPPYETLQNSGDIATLFKEGNLAMAFGNHALVPAFSDIEDFEWNIVRLPQQKRRANLAAGAGYVIAADTKQPQAAWEFLKFLSGPKGQAIFAEAGLAVPARRSVAESEIFIDSEQPFDAQMFLDEVEIGEPDPAFVGANQIINMMNDEVLPPVWRGEQDAASAIQAALANIETILVDNQQLPD